MARALEQRLAIEDCPLQEQCIDSDGPQFIKQLPPFCSRPGELRVSQLEECALQSRADSLCPWIRHQRYSNQDQDRAAPADPTRDQLGGSHSEPRDHSDRENHARRRQGVVDGVSEARQKLYCISRSVIFVFVKEAT